MTPTIGPTPPRGTPPEEAGAGRARTTGGRMSRRAWYLTINSVLPAWALAAIVVAVLQGRITAAGWLIVHLLLLGMATTAILIWSQYFADTLVRRVAAGGRRSLGSRILVQIVGAVTVLVGVVVGEWPVIAAGAGVLAVAIVWHVVVLSVQLRGTLPARFAPLVRYYLVAALLLVVGIGLGVLMTYGGVGVGAHDRLFLAHVVINVAGWIGLTVIGTVILLWPTVLHARILSTADAAARRALPLCATGILIVGAGCLIDLRPVAVAGLLIYLAGLLLVLRESFRQARSAPPTTYAAWSMACALAWFACSVIALAAIVALAPDWAGVNAAIGSLLVPFALGFVAQLIAAALSHLIPVVVAGGPTPSRRMYAVLERAGAFRVLLFNSAVLVSVFPLPAAVRVVLVAVAVAVLVSVMPLAVLAMRQRSNADAVVPPRSVAERRSATSLHALSGGMMAAIGTVVLAVALGVSAAGGPGAAMGNPGVGQGEQSAGSTVSPTGRTTTVAMTMKNMRFSPSTVTVPAGNRLVIHLRNADQQVHDLTLATGVTSGRLVGGASATVDVGVVTADIDGWCSITGHRQMGMVMRIVASGAPRGEASSQGGDSGMDMGSGSESGGPSAADDIDLSKDPPAAFRARDARLPAASASKVHRVTLTVRDVKTHVAPGITQTLWTYNGTAPGPTLRGHVGDRFIITLINDGDMGHSIDFHAGQLSPDQPMRTIDPGERLTYSFTAERSGIWLYHCSTMPMSEHIANGMFGAVIIDPPGLDRVDREFVLIQSEYYLGPQGGIADYRRVATQHPDLVVFNGYANQYRYRPLKAKAGERVRIWVLDAGPNTDLSFHIVGTQFDTVFKEGDYLLKNGGSTGTGGSQVLGLMPAQGGFVELTFPAAGDYSIVNHIMSDAEIGASGVFHVAE